MSSGLKVGLVNFVTNTPYGSIHKFCPSTDFMKRLQEGKLLTVPYYAKNRTRHNETQEYNNVDYEVLRYKNYFGENKNIVINGFINQTTNLYLVSKFLNDGLTFIVLSLPYDVHINSLLFDIDKYFTIIKKNSPKISPVFLLRYPNTNNYCILETSPEEVKKAIFKKYPECVNVLIHPFTYNTSYETTYATYIDIQTVIRDFYENEDRFVSFTDDECNVIDMLYNTDKILSKKSIYTESTMRSICNASHMTAELFMDKIVHSGLFNRFDGKVINQYYFKNGTEDSNIIPVLLNMFSETTYVKSKRTNLGRHYISNIRFRGTIPAKFKKRVFMPDRLILKIFNSLKAGRTTIGKDKLYLRKYDHDEIGSLYVNVQKPRFI